MNNTTTESASSRQTFALFCATGQDWRKHNLTREKASLLLSLTANLRGDKPAALAICQKAMNGETVEAPATQPTHQDIFDAAHAAGLKAAEECTPRAMVVCGKVIEGGVCGFAWVSIRPATSSFARWMKKEGHADKAYNGGLCLWVGGYGQSMARKSAYAGAFAKVLCDAGITASPRSRMD